MFYFQLENILPEYRSKLKSIYLLAIVEYRYLKKYGVENILAPFIKDLNILGSDMGYDFQVHNGIIRLRGALLAIVADTPASNMLGGFKESVGGQKENAVIAWVALKTYNQNLMKTIFNFEMMNCMTTILDS